MLDKFEARSVDGIFFGYASHSRAYRVLNLETNQIVETCEVTFDETQPRSQLVFECASDDELGEEIFQEEEHEHGDDEDGSVVPPVEHVPTTSTTVVDGPSPTPTEDGIELLGDARNQYILWHHRDIILNASPTLQPSQERVPTRI
jgi:hypothetical protein